MIKKYVWLGLLLASIYLLYSQDYFKIVTRYFLFPKLNDLIHVLFSVLEFNASSTELSRINEKVFTEDELKEYNNIENGLYLSILGQIFDVTKGAKHYEPGATYHNFIGRDASLAFVTGEFDKNESAYDFSKLSDQEIKALDDWVRFYNERYIYKGKLHGRYFRKDGTPTLESLYIQQRIMRARERTLDEEHRKKMFPSCNIEWKPDTGSTVWCSTKSGNIERDWIGVPRMYFENPGSTNYRCACVNLESKQYKESKGNFKEYDGCAKNSIKCKIITNKKIDKIIK